VIVATDAPLAAADLTRLARRAGLGLARTGSVAHHGSGEIFLALSTGARAPRGNPVARPQAVWGEDLDWLFSATVEATEAAVLNALWQAERTVGREGVVAERLPHEELLELLSAHGRLAARPA
jgi:D-aminopeptidase